jgi:hypothetical protein
LHHKADGAIWESGAKARENQVRAVLDVVFREFLGIDYVASEDASIDHVRIEVGGNGAAAVLGVDDRFLGTSDDRWLHRESLPVSPLPRWRLPPAEASAEPDIPVLFASSTRPPADCDLHLPIDIPGALAGGVSREMERLAATCRRFGGTLSILWHNTSLLTAADRRLGTLGLVLQAGFIGHGGEVFVLDMGEPVRIAELARDMIRLSGLLEGREPEDSAACPR